MSSVGIYYVRLVVKWDVVDAEVRLQALKGAVRRGHGTAATVAPQSNWVGDDRVNARQTIRKLKCLVVQFPICAHMLIRFAKQYLHVGILEKSKWKNRFMC